MKYLFYYRQSGSINNACCNLPDIYSVEIFRPKIYKIFPRGIAKLNFLFWWILWLLRLFSSPDYHGFIVYHEAKVIHYSIILPKFFRFPFMAVNDFQIGPCWTHEEYRRKGIHSLIIQKILKTFNKEGSRLWYVTREENIASVRSIKKAGFTLQGSGFRKKRLGIRVFGAFVMEEQLD